MTEITDIAESMMDFPAADPRIHHGVWRFRVSYWDYDAMTTDGESSVAIKGGARVGMASAIMDYQHGPPVSAPTGFTAHNAGPDARRLVWDVCDRDRL